jgi:DNA-binding NarL/FixJ family response regulator
VRPPAIKPVSVLVVDGSALIRRRLRALLVEDNRLGVVGQAAGVQEAWELFDQFRPDAVVLDLQLSDGSGIDVLKRIKKTMPSCFVIILTNLCETSFRQECHRCGADHFLRKATEFERLIPLLLDHPDGSPPRPRSAIAQ